MRRFRSFALLAIVLAALVVGTRLSLPLLAHFLIRDDALARADVIVVLGAHRIGRTLEAGVLFRQGWSPRILLLRSPDWIDRDLTDPLHIHLPDWIDIQKSALAQMGVPASAIQESGTALGNTRAEARFVARFASRMSYKRVIVVSSPYHTRRAKWLLRSAAANSFAIIVRPTRYEPIHPDQWWAWPLDRSDIVFEYLKFVFDTVPGQGE
ncbi:MAG TPA: YdcF family protein [Thermoanaerobaculia bacterium]